VQQDWGSEQDKSLNEIKRIMSSEPVLKLADLNEPFVVQCDASNTGIGGVLMQKEGGKNHPVMCASRKLLPRELVLFFPSRSMTPITWQAAIDDEEQRPATAARHLRSSRRWASCLGKIAKVVSRCLPRCFTFECPSPG